MPITLKFKIYCHFLFIRYVNRQFYHPLKSGLHSCLMFNSDWRQILRCKRPVDPPPGLKNPLFPPSDPPLESVIRIKRVENYNLIIFIVFNFLGDFVKVLLKNHILKLVFPANLGDLVNIPANDGLNLAHSCLRTDFHTFNLFVIFREQKTLMLKQNAHGQTEITHP